MTHDELLALIDDYSAPPKLESGAWTVNYFAEKTIKALRAVVDLCAIPDKVTIGDKGLYNSGRNSMRDEIKQAIEKELV